MLPPLICLPLLVMYPTDDAAPTGIAVQSVVVSLIDDVHVASPEAGVLGQIAVREGGLVQEGAVIAELDSIDARLEYERVAAELQIVTEQATNDLAVQLAKKAYGVADAELLRSLKSNEKFADAVSSTELDKLRLSRDQAALQIEHAEHELKLAGMRVDLKSAELNIARRQMERRRITAPLSGTVVKVHQQQGEWIQPGETCVRIIRTDRVRAEGFVHINAGPVTAGQPVEVVLTIGAAEPLTFRGEVTFVDPEIETVTGQYRVWAEIDNPEGMLRPGHRPHMRVLSKDDTES